MAGTELHPSLADIGGEIYIEGGYRPAEKALYAMSLGGRLVTEAEFARDPVWQEPNTFPVVRIDTREITNADGTATVLYYNGNVGHITDAQFASSVYNRLNYIYGLLGRHWPSGKPRRWALLLAGFDGTNGGYADNGSDLWIVRHPGDRFSFSSGGHTYYTGSGYVANAIADTAPIISGYIDAFVNKMSSDHDPDVSDLYPMRVWTDAESTGDIQGVASSLWTAMLADIRASTEDNVGTQTVAAFASDNALDIGNSTIAFNAGFSTYHPENFDFTNRCQTAVLLAYQKALNEIVFNKCRSTIPHPINEAYVVACGEWNVGIGDRVHPTQFRPEQGEYMFGGYWATAGCTPILASYGGPRIYRRGILNDDAPYEDLRWEGLYQWEQWFNISPGLSSVRDRERAVAKAASEQLLVQTGEAMDGWSVVPHSVLCPSSFGRMEYAAHTANLMTAAWNSGAGCDAFWLFEPNWQYHTEARAAVAKYVRLYNANLGLKPLGVSPTTTPGLRRRQTRAR